MKNAVASAVALIAFVTVLLAASITPASAQQWYHRHHHYWHHHVYTPGVTVWSAPQPGWHWHSRAWWNGHPSAWRSAHPYHSAINGGVYLQF